MSDYPMLISNKLHSFRNFRMQSYKTFHNDTYSIAKYRFDKRLSLAII